MDVIYKWPFENADLLTISSDYPIDFLTTQFQNDSLCVWGIVHKKQELKNSYKYCINIYGTDWSRKEISGKYVGTVQEGPYVWHLFVEESFDDTLEGGNP